jgi:3-methyladenine DNA glycosylase AlkD
MCRSSEASERIAAFGCGRRPKVAPTPISARDPRADLGDRDRALLFELAASEVLWERRVAVLSTIAFIKHGDASTTLELSALLLDDPEDLMHEAVGWMLREVGKRVDRALLLGFLDAHAARMPRTTLSYATEHLDPELRAEYRRRR